MPLLKDAKFLIVRRSARRTRHDAVAAVVYADEAPVIARLIKPVVVIRHDGPSVVETLLVGATVEFESVNPVGIIEVVCDGKTYLVTAKDLLEAAHPAAWARSDREW